MNCKRQGCHNQAAEKQVYCSRNCAPYGNFSRDNPHETESRRKEREAKWRQHRMNLQKLSDDGKTLIEASESIGLSIVTIKVYARRWGIKFKRKNAAT